MSGIEKNKDKKDKKPWQPQKKKQTYQQPQNQGAVQVDDNIMVQPSISKKQEKKPAVKSEQQKNQSSSEVQAQKAPTNAVKKKRERKKKPKSQGEKQQPPTTDNQPEPSEKIGAESSTQMGHETNFDTYDLVDAKVKDKTLGEFRNTKPTQKTASTYHSLSESQYYDTHKNDDTKYRRSQRKHKFSDENNLAEGDFNFYDQIKYRLSKNTKSKFNFGANPSFGTQIKTKNKPKNNKNADRKTKKEYSSAKKQLDDDILNHKVASVGNIVEGLQLPTDELKTIKAYPQQLDAKYPCVIISLDDDYPQHAEMIKKDIKDQYDKAYPEFLTHLMIACINKQLVDQGLGVYFDRRQSFGFLTPTASDVGPGIRLSLGLVPNPAWENAVVAGIKDFDNLLDKLWKDNKITTEEIKPIEATTKKKKNKKDNAEENKKMGLPQKEFNTGEIKNYGHKLFLQALIEDSVKKNNTSEISTNESEPEAIVSIIQDLHDEKSKNKLIESTVKGNFFEATGKFLDEAAEKGQEPASEEFSELSSRIAAAYDNANAALAQTNPSEQETQTVTQESSVTEEKVAETRSNNTISKNIVSQIEEFQEKSVEKLAKLDEINATSASETDEKTPLNGEQKYYSPTGMSALVAPLIAYRNSLREGVEEDVQRVTYKTEQYAYFELAEWEKTNVHGKLINKFENDISKEHESSNYDVNIIYVDNNPCVIGKTPPISTLDVIKNYEQGTANNGQAKMLVVDTTSATEEQKDKIIAEWQKSNIDLLCFATSGLKNKQLGLDMAQYGENRLYVNPNSPNNTFTQDVAKNLRKITRGTSSPYATMVIRDLREATAKTATSEETRVDESSNPSSKEATVVENGTPASNEATVKESSTPSSNEATEKESSTPPSKEATVQESSTPSSNETTVEKSNSPTTKSPPQQWGAMASAASHVTQKIDDKKSEANVTVDMDTRLGY